MNRIFPFPVDTLLRMLGIFAVFNIFYLTFVVRRFDTKVPVPGTGTLVLQSEPAA
jgi:hypothetical protein